MGSIVAALLQIVAYWIQKAAISDEAKRLFFQFIKQAGSELKSVKLYNDAVKQLQQFKEEPFKPEPGQPSE